MELAKGLVETPAAANVANPFDSVIPEGETALHLAVREHGEANRVTSEISTQRPAKIAGETSPDPFQVAVEETEKEGKDPVEEPPMKQEQVAEIAPLPLLAEESIEAYEAAPTVLEGDTKIGDAVLEEPVLKQVAETSSQVQLAEQSIKAYEPVPTVLESDTKIGDAVLEDSVLKQVAETSSQVRLAEEPIEAYEPVPAVLESDTKSGDAVLEEPVLKQVAETSLQVQLPEPSIEAYEPVPTVLESGTKIGGGVLEEPVLKQVAETSSQAQLAVDVPGKLPKLKQTILNDVAVSEEPQNFDSDTLLEVRERKESAVSVLGYSDIVRPAAAYTSSQRKTPISTPEGKLDGPKAKSQLVR